MSQPKRYVVTYDDGFIAWEYREANESDRLGKENIWVKESDYAALAADRDKWKSWADAENKDRKRDHADACDYIQMIVKEKNALAAEKEALVQQGIRDHQDWRSKLNFLEADYKAEVARLTAENERLREAWIDKKMEQDRDALLAENERLRKAAQAVYDELHTWGNNSPMVIQNLMDTINAAKEGGRK